MYVSCSVLFLMNQGENHRNCPRGRDPTTAVTPRKAENVCKDVKMTRNLWRNRRLFFCKAAYCVTLGVSL